jgi:hypothetical protein
MNFRQKICIASGIILMIIVLMTGFLIQPLVKEIKKSATIVSEASLKLKSLKNFDISHTALLEADYKVARDNLALFQIDLSEKQVIDLIVEMEKQADSSANDLTIRAAEFPQFTLYLVGSFPNMMKFLGWLENSAYLISVKSLSIAKLSENSMNQQEAAIAPGSVRTILEIELPIKQAKLKNESKGSI